VTALRVVLDTNVLVSAIAFPHSIPGLVLNAWTLGQLDLVVSQYILGEMVRVLPKFPQIQLDSLGLSKLADNFALKAQLVEPSTVTEALLRDKADAPVLGTFVASQADYLITGDKDLLALADRYPIVTPAQFWDRHGS
jgi:putative PIN family toxin of toxin-antitoxin system